MKAGLFHHSTPFRITMQFKTLRSGETVTRFFISYTQRFQKK